LHRTAISPRLLSLEITEAPLLREQGCDAAQGWLFGRPFLAEGFDQVFQGAPTRWSSAG
jgi:sensor c-di-GMP phosphodiesterase-like protein